MKHHCRFCGGPDLYLMIDLGHMPPSNSFLTREQLDLPETHYPLKVFVCKRCWLVQLPEFKAAKEIFTNSYVYHSSASPANVTHAQAYANRLVRKFDLRKGQRVLEIGSNDGYLLQWFKDQKLTVKGVDPARDAAEEAIAKGIPTDIAFFNYEYARKLRSPYDLICGINILAQIPDINDFVKGLKVALAKDGVITFEFPYLLNLIEHAQFDTIYHEHYSYFSLTSLMAIFSLHNLHIFDVETIPEHGGSLRVYAGHEDASGTTSRAVLDMLSLEGVRGIRSLTYYDSLRRKTRAIREGMMDFLHKEGIHRNCLIMGYGAAAKGNTLLNVCGLRADTVTCVVDRSPHKQGLFLPGSHIPVVSEDVLKSEKPEYVLILAWNLKKEIMEQLKYIKEWKGRFIVPIPTLEII